MFNFKKLFTKEDWRLVKTYDMSVNISGAYTVSKSSTVYIHLFESDRGHRRIESTIGSTEIDDVKLLKFVHTTELYNTVIYRWLAGRVDPDIPRYSQIPEEETVNMLVGKVSLK